MKHCIRTGRQIVAVGAALAAAAAQANERTHSIGTLGRRKPQSPIHGYDGQQTPAIQGFPADANARRNRGYWCAHVRPTCSAAPHTRRRCQRSQALLVAWKTVQQDARLAALLLAMSSEVALVVAALGLAHLRHLVDCHHRHLRPRWDTGARSEAVFCAR